MYIREKDHRYIKFRVEDFFERVRYPNETPYRNSGKQRDEVD